MPIEASARGGITRSMSFLRTRLHRFAFATGLSMAAWLIGCGTGGKLPGQLSNAEAPSRTAQRPPPSPSNAASARAYRQDAARHLYAIEAVHVLPGRLPPLLYAVGTLQVDIGAAGEVKALHWLRAPTHAADAIAQTERIVLEAAPYPVATRLGPVTWTDTWLWDKKGRFQLDTLSEGQD